MATNRLIQNNKISIYAGELFKAANENGGQDEVVSVRNQLKEIMHIIFGDMDLSFALSDVDYTPEQRKQLCLNVFADIDPVLREVLAVMSENGDIDLISRVFHAYEDVVEEELNLCVVDVVTVVELDDALRTLIKEKTEADLRRTVVLSESIDESILGGIIMSANGRRIDASVVTQLNHTRQVLKDTVGGEI